MNVSIVAVDKVREPYVRTGCDAYLARIAPYFRVDVIEVRPSHGDAARAAEGRALLARVGDGAVLWALDPAGTKLTSPGLAERLAALEHSGARRLAIVIGGAGGLDDAVLERADLRWSLSDLTFLHEMARLIALEQLYRAAKINRGEPYHR